MSPIYAAISIVSLIGLLVIAALALDDEDDE